jgi:alpha/beta superfamily hydrolase
MPKKINEEFPIQFPMDMYHSFSGLGERGLMTPTYLSTLIMSAILPAKFIVEKKKPLVNDEQGLCTVRSWFERANFEEYPFNTFKTNYYDKMAKTHTLASLSVDGLETLEAKQKQPNPNQQYEIFCCGNGQDAMHIYTAYNRIATEPNKNYIFWNYPGVGSSKGGAHSTHNLFNAGYQQAKRLIDQGIPAQNITLHGLSLGGGVATLVARQLHEEGHLVNLEIDRSFARIASVIPASLKRNMINEDTSKQSSYAPLITSTVALALSGVALGTTFAGFVSSVGLVTASATAAIGYIGAFCIQAVGFLLQEIMTIIGEMIAFPFSFFSKSISDDIKSLFNNIGYSLAYPFNLAAFAINETFSTIASFLDNAVNLISSIVGGAIAIGGLVAGSLAGLVFGALLSIQLLWTEKPLTMPMTPAFSAALYSSCCEMDSVSEMHRLLNADNKPENIRKKQPKISVTNVIDDEVIDVAASLSIGLGLKPGKPSDDENRPLKEKITSFWYRSGGHNGDLVGLIDPNLSFSQ